MMTRWLGRGLLACCLGFGGGCLSGSPNRDLAPDRGPADAPPLPGAATSGAPQVFAPGFITTAVNTRDVTLTPDGRELYFCMASPGYAQAAILVTRYAGGSWSEPEVAPFSGNPDFMDLEPFVSPDGRRLYFMSTRPTPGAEEGNADLWLMDRQGDGWGPPRPVGPPINTEQDEYFPAVTRDGTLYFTRADSTGRVNSIWRAAPAGDGFGEPELLPAQVNCGTNRFNATVSPDGRRVILSALGVSGSHGLVDYFLVTRDAADRWSEPINLGPTVNDGALGGWSACVTPDGADFLFMSARRSGGTDEWPARWTMLQSDHNRAGGGNPVVMRMSAGFLDSLAAGRVMPTMPQTTAIASNAGTARAFPKLSGAYLGQEPPGLVPRLFAPGIVSTGLNERDIGFSAEGDRLWYGVLERGLVTVMESRLENGFWTEPQTVPFHTDRKFFCFEAAAVPNSAVVIFLANRAAPGQTQGQGWANQNLHYAVFEAGRWSAAKTLPPPVTTERAEYFPAVASDGTLYFSREDADGHPALWAAEPAAGNTPGAYHEPVRLPARVNVGPDTFNATVAPDESWLIYCVNGHPENLGDTDYWIATRDEQGQWTAARNLGAPFNGPGWRGASVSLSPDGRYLFFSSDRSAPAEFFPTGRVTRNGLLKMHRSPGNGGLDIWWVDARILRQFF